MKRALGNISVALMSLFLFNSAVHAYNLPDTGQTLCYNASGTVIDCAHTGQDGAYNINPMSYTDNGNGTVTDNNTGLMWQKCSAGQTDFTDCSGGAAATYNWYRATGTSDPTYNPSGGTNICGSLNTSNFGGHSDWRLPAEQELQTIVDYSIQSPSPTIKASYFPNTIASHYWSSTTDAGNSDYAWRVLFYDGNVAYSVKNNVYYVRCVRGGQTSQSFASNSGYDSVTDNKTGLIWQKCSAGQNNDSTCSGSASSYTWNAALEYCKTPQLYFTDWRLPNVKELKSLTDISRYNPAINTDLFPGTIAAGYWSSNTDTNSPDVAQYVDFGYGYAHPSSKSNSYYYYVRCVRGGHGEESYVRLMRGDTPINTFNNIQDAYNQAITGDVIQMQAVGSFENQTFVAAKAVSLKGGYDSGFTLSSDFTTVSGNMTIIGGAITVEKIIIK
jgi:hypothetical protein